MAVALVVAVLRVQERREKDQVVGVGSIVDLRLPVEAAATSVVQITIRVIVVASTDK